MRLTIPIIPILIIVASGCATTPESSTGLKAAMQKAKKQCMRLQKTPLKTPVQTDIRLGLDRIQQAVSEEKSETAQARAESLAYACESEAKSREELAVIAKDVEKKRQDQPAAYDRFFTLLSKGNYTDAILCGEGLQQNKPAKCGGAKTAKKTPESRPIRKPVAQQMPARRPGVKYKAFSDLQDVSDDPDGDSAFEDVDYDEDVDMEAQAVMRHARANRMAVSLSFGFGTASMGGVHDLADDASVNFAIVNPGNDLSGAPKSGVQINGELALRYYFDYHLLAQLGYSMLYNMASSSFGFGEGTLSNDNVAMEVPLMLGGYLTMIDRIYLYGAAGPSFLLLSRWSWSSDPGGAPNYKSDPTVGAHFLVGGDFMLIDRLALGLELRYRLLKAGAMKDTEDGETVLSGQLRGDGTDDTYEADLSGISFALHLRLFIF
jgi:hypothetical protein